ncbi:hypothetical protein [Bdellovibrio sp. KM01]|uniref:hypothetical protein n=1 Tax=Bdellovibrio sp. KM01 TaxID=2748865 RepID=UPI002102DF6E|nr:hypothetical protein [Bdellovibrio sp. KM01]
MKRIFIILMMATWMSFCLSELALASSWINIDFIKKNAVPVRRVMDDVVFLARSNRVAVGDLVVVLRVQGDDVEVIARGAAETVQNNELLVVMEGPSISKIPKARDWVVSLSKLKPPPDDPLFPQPPDVPIIEQADPYEPGYMIFEMGTYQGHFESQSPNQANQYKVYDFKFTEMHFLWYIDMLWRYGIEYQSSSAGIPVKSYYREDRPTTSEETRMSLHYRMLPIWKELRPTLKLISLGNKFITTNEDEYVLSSQSSGLGLGVNFHYLFSDNLYKTEKGLGWKLNRVYCDMNYFLSYNVTDGSVSRGGASSGTMMEIKVGATALFYVPFIPWLKRYSLDVSYGLSQAEMSFSGDTKSAPDGAYVIPAGQSYSESQSYFKVMLGLRLDDFVSKLMKTR